MIHVREAADEDAEDMTEVQNAIHRAGLRPGPVEAALVRERYLIGDYRVACTVAEQQGRVIAFQSLVLAWPENRYGVAEGWGIIGTHVHPGAGRSGVGRRLFERTRLAAQAAGIWHIDASIGSDNAPALAYYSAMGFVPDHERGNAIAYRLDI